MAETPWQFDEPPNEAVVTLRSFIEDGRPILRVVRDAEDGTWQFLTGEPFSMDEAKLVALQSVIAKDSSLIELRDLVAGWEASRIGVGEAWRRQRSVEE
ncbi:hypothetical protein [Usitatibacter rugosus]|uniref:hypothetical protein n=1 Tax=Usitatibacter rugosus TaxID=2732067 RepID=UPI001487D80B|nr:hypothetical protein [Usitatibacter rugosus]